MAKPKRTFSGQEGQRSVGTAGPEGISYDLDNLFAALDPDDTFKDGTPGGVGEENLRTDSISDRALGERTVDQSESPSSNTGLLTNVLSWFGNMIKKITGETNWFDTPATTLKAAKTHIDANAPHSGHINAINNIQGGNITLKAGANVEISQNTATKEVTIATSGTIAPSSHASSHAIGGADQITPASIGAAASTHTHTPASIGAVPAVSGKGLSTNDFTTALLNKLNGIDEGAQVNRPISSQVQAQDGTDNSTVMTPLRVAEAFDKRAVFARVDQVLPGTGTVTRRASSPTDYNTIKFNTLLPAGENTAWFGVTFPSLGDVVVGTPQYNLSTLSLPGTLEFGLFQTLVESQLGGISIYHGIETFGQNRVRFLLTRASGTGALNDIYLHFRFTGLKLA